MMTFEILKQRVGVTDNFEPKVVSEELIVFVGKEYDGNVIKLVCNKSDTPYYSRVVEGEGRFSREALRGEITILLITTAGVIELGSYICVLRGEDIVIYRDAKDVARALHRAERDISECLDIIARLEGKYDDLDGRLKRLFVGYEM